MCVFNDNKIHYPSLFVQKSTQPLPVTRTVSQVSSLMRGRQLTPEAMRRKVSQLVRLFEWDAGDLALLREAKQAQLSARGMCYADVSQHITRKELERHYLRRTRGADETTILIQALIDVLDSPSGCVSSTTSASRRSGPFNIGMSAASRTSTGCSCTVRRVP